MLTQKELEAAVRKMIANLDEVNLYFIQKIATQIKKIGEMNPTSISRHKTTFSPRAKIMVLMSNRILTISPFSRGLLRG